MNFHSKLLNENAELHHNGTVLFANGAEYTKGEVDVLRGKPEKERKSVHLVKTHFGGTFAFMNRLESADDQRKIQTVLPR